MVVVLLESLHIFLIWQKIIMILFLDQKVNNFHVQQIAIWKDFSSKKFLFQVSDLITSYLTFSITCVRWKYSNNWPWYCPVFKINFNQKNINIRILNSYSTKVDYNFMHMVNINDDFFKGHPQMGPHLEREGRFGKLWQFATSVRELHSHIWSSPKCEEVF